MTFDEKLKARAQREGSPTPEGVDERMDALLRDLPAQVTPIKKRRPARQLLYAIQRLRIRGISGQV